MNDKSELPNFINLITETLNYEYSIQHKALANKTPRYPNRCSPRHHLQFGIPFGSVQFQFSENSATPSITHYISNYIKLY